MLAADSAIAARPKTAMISILIVAFLCGAAAGAVGMKSYAFRMAHHELVASENKADTLARWRKELKLTDDQTAQLRMILDDFTKYYDNVLAEGHERILQVLTPQQRKIFEKKLQERY